ncbi:MAG TPA: mechanosensitive ion channel domain-containing protein, partial [Ignavibacteriaceae bacterium]
MNELLSKTFLGNSYFDYLIALATFVGGLILIFLFKKILLVRLKKWADSTDTTIDDLLVKAIQKSLIPVFYFGIFYISIKNLALSKSFENGLNVIIVIITTFLVVRTIISIINYFLGSYLKNTEDSEQREKQLKGIRGLVNLVIWSIALIFMLDNLGVKISAVVAGLGIGGIAVALAAQAFLGDLFSYFAIFFDKPFEIGDFIIVGDKLGAVENIGIKTTRVRAIGGEQLVFSNHDLTNSRIHNYKKMERRRVVFKLGVIYQTSSEKLKQIPKIVKDIIDQQGDATFDRGHFAAYGDFSLNFEFVYYVTGADYNKYMDIQQAINLSIFEAFENEKIEFAYPTQTVFVNKENFK